MSKLLETGKLLTHYLSQKTQVIEMTEDLLKLNDALREEDLAQLSREQVHLASQFLVMLHNNSSKKETL